MFLFERRQCTVHFWSARSPMAHTQCARFALCCSIRRLRLVQQLGMVRARVRRAGGYCYSMYLLKISCSQYCLHLVHLLSSARNVPISTSLHHSHLRTACWAVTHLSDKLTGAELVTWVVGSCSSSSISGTAIDSRSNLDNDAQK